MHQWLESQCLPVDSTSCGPPPVGPQGGGFVTGPGRILGFILTVPLNKNMSNDAVYFEIDQERTSADAYYEFKVEVLKEFAEEDVSASDDRTRKLSKTDPNIVAEAAKMGFFLVKSMMAMKIYDYIKSRGTEDSDVNTVIQTGEGPVYIEEVSVKTEDAAKERVHNN